MAETSQECSVYAMSNSSVFSTLRWNELVSSAEQQSNVSEFQTEGALTMKTFADNAGVMRGTNNNWMISKYV